MNIYPLKSILSTFADENGKHRMMFNPAAIGGYSSKILVLIIASFPFIIYAAIFNDYIFNKFGIATCIVAYIVFLSFFMNIGFFIVWNAKRRTIKKIAPSWEHYFGDRDIEMVLSKGVSPYNKFFDHYSVILKDNPSEDELHKKLLSAFDEMEEENKDLVEAIKKNK